MSLTLAAALPSLIAGLLRVDDVDAVGEALLLSLQLPYLPSDDGEQNDDSVPQLLFDIGFRLERFERNEDAIAIYRRLLDHPGCSARLAAGAWFRLAYLLDRSADWVEAISAYRRALELAPDWDHMSTLARYHLAGLAAAGEQYLEAAALYEAVDAAPPHPDISSPKVLLELGRCRLQGGQWDGASDCFERILRSFPEASGSTEAIRLLADLHERKGDWPAAVACYDRIVASPFAEPALRSAAAHRSAGLRREKVKVQN